MIAGTTYGWHDQVTRFQATDGGADFLDLSERFVPDHQIVISSWWRARFEGANLSVRTTDTDVEHVKHYLIRLGEPGRFVLDNLECFLFLEKLRLLSCCPLSYIQKSIWCYQLVQFHPRW